MADKKRRRRRGPTRETAFSLARQMTLAPITHGEDRRGSSDAFLFEPAWDGHRMLATRVGDTVRLAALDFRDWTHIFPGAVRAMSRLASDRFAIDGVVCALGAGGVPSFERLRAAVAAGKAVTYAVLICWDLMY